MSVRATVRGIDREGSGERARLGETAAVALVLALLAAALLGDYVFGGGFAWDDWENAATTAYPPASGFLGPIDLGTFAFRPLLALLLAGTQAALGPRPALHLALALVLAVAMSVAVFGVLREVGVERPLAAAVAALTLLFPWSDSTRLWATAGLNNLAVVLWLGGLWLSLRAVRARGRRVHVRHAGAVALYVASILLYQATAVAIVASVLAIAYRAGAARARRGFLLAGAAVVPLGLATAVGMWAVDEARSLADTVAHAGRIASESLALMGRAAVPFGDAPPRAVGVVLLAALALAGAWAWRSEGVHSFGERQAARRGLGLALAGLAVLACAYAVFVPGDKRYVPLASGTANRVNLVAAIGYALLVTGAAWALGALAAAALGRAGVASAGRRATAVVVAFAALAAIGVGWATTLRADARAWERAAVLRDEVLVAVRRHAKELGPGTTVLTVGHPSRVLPGVPVFATAWDLNGAVKLTLADGRVRGRPLTDLEPIRCGKRTLEPAPTYNSIPERPAYGRTLVLDVRTGRALPIRNHRDCRRVAADAATGRLPVVAKGAP